jgi:GNAT superfamily N-acetyltransferase
LYAVVSHSLTLAATSAVLDGVAASVSEWIISLALCTERKELIISTAITIRSAAAADVPSIFSLIKALAEYERLLHTVTATEDLLAETLFGEHPYAEVLLAECDGEIAGFALFFHNYSTFVGKPGIYIEDIFVRPEQRGKGIGAALLKRIAALAHKKGCGRMEWSVLDWNEPAIGFYKRLGARPLEDWTLYRLDAEGIEALASGGG